MYSFRCSRAAYSIVSDGICPKFKLIHTFIYVLVIYKNEENQMKNEGSRVVITLYSYVYFRRSRAANYVAGGWVWPKIKLIQTFMVVLVTCKNEEIHSKMKVLEWSQQISNCKSMQIFYDVKGKLTAQSEVGSNLNLNSSKLLWLSVLPARIKKIQSKMKALEWSQQCYIIDQFLRCSRAANSLIGDGIFTKFKLIGAFIVVLLI